MTKKSFTIFNNEQSGVGLNPQRNTNMYAVINNNKKRGNSVQADVFIGPFWTKTKT